MAKRRENKLSQLLRESLQTAPSVYYKKLNRWLLIPGRLSDDHRPLYTSHLTALLVTSVLRWIMQEMLWRIRHSGAEESCLSVWTCFRMKSETHLDASLAGKDKKISGKNQKKKKKVFGGLWFRWFSCAHKCLYHVWTCKEYTWLFARNPVNGECVNQFPAVCLSHLITPACPFPQGPPLLLEHLVSPEEGTKCLGLGSAGAGNHCVGTRAGGGHLTHRRIKIYLQIFPSVSTSQLSSRARWFKRCVAFHCGRPKYTKKKSWKNLYSSLSHAS